MQSSGFEVDAGMLLGNLLIRGARANPDSSIGTFKNVGGMKRDSTVWPSYPFLTTAWRILDEDPLDATKLEDVEASKLQNSFRWSGHLRQLQGVLMEPFDMPWDSKLVEDETEAYVANELKVARRICGKYTSVWKDVDVSPPVARVIFDLRRLNAVCNSTTVPFTILGAPQMITEMRSVPTERGMFTIVHADLANFYYQIGVGKKLSRRMLLLWGKMFMQSKVLCMGFSKACGIAMAICLSLILRQEPEDADLGIPEEPLSSESAPGCVRLKNGGIIFLVYDSIMIVCPKKDARLWERKLNRDFSSAGLCFKYLSVAAPGEVVTYCGMEIYSDREGIKWRLAGSSLATWKVLRRAELRRTPRTLFKIVSYLRFSMAVMGEARWKLGRVSKSQSRLGLVTMWDEICVEQDEIDHAWSLFDMLVSGWEKPDGWRHRRSHVPKIERGGSLFVVVAVDATPFSWAVDVLEENGVVQNLSRSGKFRRELPIAEAEAKGSMEGLRVAKELPAPVVILCNDNRSIGRAFWKGYSGKDELDEVVKEGVRFLVRKVYVGVDVPTKENFADIGTRRERVYTPAEVVFRHSRTFARAMKAALEWRTTGVDYFGREVFDLDDEEKYLDEIIVPEHLSDNEDEIKGI